jgi:hypothetical protein
MIPFIIPTSVKTRKKWIIDTMNTPLLGGYLIMFFALLPPLIIGWISGVLVASFFNFSDYWLSVIFISGIFLFIWDRWLRFTYDTEIKLVYIPIEYLSYIIMGTGIVFIYG